jgi:uncharacterized RDD family membrane protein YckC
MNYAGFWIRFWAVVVDSLILSIFGVLLGIIVFLLEPDANFSEGITSFYYSINFIISALIPWLYGALFESGSWQATPGKRLMGIYVTNLEGQKISFARASGRHFSKILSGLIILIGYIMVGLTDKKQGLHDKVADTLVLRGKAEVSAWNTDDRSRSIEDNLTVDVSGSVDKSIRWVLAGFDSDGHIVRLIFSQDDTRLQLNGLFVGRDSNICELHISDSSVSRRHARLFKNQGLLLIEDLGSTNGLTVNGQRLSKEGSIALPDQGNISIGAVELSIGKY